MILQLCRLRKDKAKKKPYKATHPIYVNSYYGVWKSLIGKWGKKSKSLHMNRFFFFACTWWWCVCVMFFFLHSQRKSIVPQLWKRWQKVGISLPTSVCRSLAHLIPCMVCCFVLCVANFSTHAQFFFHEGKMQINSKRSASCLKWFSNNALKRP